MGVQGAPLPFNLPSLTFRPLRYRHRGIGYWSGHLPFAADLIAALRPGTFVELGTQFGESYFAFCQAIRENGMPCAAFAVDSWRGDSQAGHYCEDVFEDVEGHNAEYYSAFSTLLRMDFDRAAALFPDATIDLLHIDGLHTYEAVRHDFEIWAPKVRTGGIILLHDTQIRQGGFGVWKLWDELQKRYRTFEFSASSGLGVVLVGSDTPRDCLLESLFQSDQAIRQRIQAYYEMCSLRLERENRRKPGECDITTQLFWRSSGEHFAEARSASISHTVRAEPLVIRLVVPTMNSVPEEFRLDVADRKAILRVLEMTFRDADRQVVWSQPGDFLLTGGAHSGMEVIPGGAGAALLVITEPDPQFLLPGGRWLAAMARGGVLEIVLHSVSEEQCLQDLAHRAGSRALQLTRQGAG
jgi:hypothetical protein